MKKFVIALITVLLPVISIPIVSAEKLSYQINDLRSTGWAGGCGIEVVNYYLILTEHFTTGQIMEYNLHQAETIYKTSNLSCKTTVSLASTYTDQGGSEFINIANNEWDPLLGNTYIID